MKTTDKFIYHKTMKDARIHLKNMGHSLLIFMFLFSLFKTFLLVPALGKLWGLFLSTTPDGFISNSNFLHVLTHAPWVLLGGLMIVLLYAFIAMWQTSLLLIWISYMRNGQRILLKDLFRLSFVQFGKKLHAKNWLILFHALVIIPLTDLYQTNSIIKAFVVPSYIMDYINSKPVLFSIYCLLMLVITYIALRWLFLLPSFILKDNDFMAARRESRNLTCKGWARNGINIFLYSIVEYIRFSVIPIILIMLPLSLCYFLTRKLEFAMNLFYTIGLAMSYSFVKSLSGTLAQISILYFLVELYFAKLNDIGSDTTVSLPVLRQTDRSRINVRRLLLIIGCIFAILPAVVYLGALKLAHYDGESLLGIVGTTDIVAHKGYSSKAPENTMPAFELAAKCDKVDAIELDVWSTKDGIPVVIHNASIKDATGIEKNIYECTYDELKDIPAPYNMEAEQFPSARIPSLEDVIVQYSKTLPLIIEIKGFVKDPDLPSKIVSLLKKHNCEHNCQLQSANYKAISAVKEIDPSIECGLIIAMVTGYYYDLPNADFFSLEQSFVDLDTALLLHRRGKEVYAWTVNDTENAELLKLSGTDALITDYPELIDECVEDTNGLVEGLIKRKIIDILGQQKEMNNLLESVEGNY